MTAVSPVVTLDQARRNTELLGADLRERGLDALAHGHRAGVEGDAAGAADPHDGGLERSASRSLDAVADAEAEIAAAPLRAPLPGGEARMIDRFQRHALAGRKVAAVERDGRARAGFQRRDIGHLLRRHQIAPAHLGAIEAKLVRDAVEQALHGECGFRIAGAAHRHGGDLVGLRDSDVELVGRQNVGAGDSPVEAL